MKTYSGMEYLNLEQNTNGLQFLGETGKLLKTVRRCPGKERVIMMEQKDEVTFTHSSLLSKEGKPYVSVRFERGEDMAEGSVPACVIVTSSGFSKEEVVQLEGYLKQNARDILKSAKNITGIMNWF